MVEESKAVPGASPRRHEATDDRHAPSRRAVLQALAAVAPLVGLGSRELFAIGVQAHRHTGSEPTSWQLLGVAERATLRAIVDEILPRTDTPSASEAGVVQFVDHLVANWFPEAARKAFLERFESFRNEVEREHGSAFEQLEQRTRIEILEAFEAEGIASRDGSSVATAPARLHEQHLFGLLKWMTIWGYYTSEEGMRGERGYRVVPGRYQPDVEYSI